MSNEVHGLSFRDDETGVPWWEPGTRGDGTDSNCEERGTPRGIPVMLAEPQRFDDNPGIDYYM